MQQNQLHLGYDSTQRYAQKEGTHITTIPRLVNPDIQGNTKAMPHNYYHKTPEPKKVHALAANHITPLLAHDTSNHYKKTNYSNSLV